MSGHLIKLLEVAFYLHFGSFRPRFYVLVRNPGLASAVGNNNVSSIASHCPTHITIAIQAVHQQLVGIVVLPKLILLFVAKPPIVTNVAMLYHHSS